MKRRLLILVALALLWPAIAGARISTEHFTFHTTQGRDAMAAELAETAETVLREVSAQLGALDQLDDPITVRIFHGEDDFRAAMPHLKSIDWAAGVAFPRQSLILLKVDRMTRFEIHDIFRHEVSHVMLDRAAGQQHLPHWFIEGVAVHQAGERLLERWKKTADASLGDSLMPMAALEHGFPSEGLQADLAYAQSTAFLSWMLDLRGWAGVRATVANVREGMPFRESFEQIYGRNVDQAEDEWRERVAESATWIPILTGTTVVWLAISALFVLSWWVKRRRTRRQMAALEDATFDLDDEFA